MPKLLFPQFITDPNQYELAEKFWKKIWEEVLESTEQGQRWESPWLLNPCSDGNPIFSAIDKKRNRAVRIIQEEQTAPDDVDLDFWLDTFGPEKNSESVSELAISCILTDQTSVEVKKLLCEWVSAGKVTVYDYPLKPGLNLYRMGNLTMPELQPV